MSCAIGVQLCAETFGRAGDPALLLIHGAAASMLAWDDDFCARLAAGGSTGRSVSYPPGQPGYGFTDLAAFVWGGLYLREPRLRALLPLRR